jgi:hypothetical protein
MQLAVRCNLILSGLTDCLHRIMDGPSQTWHLEDVVASSFPSASSLDLFRGTLLVDMDGDDEDEAMGAIDMLLCMHGH